MSVAKTQGSHQQEGQVCQDSEPHPPCWPGSGGSSSHEHGSHVQSSCILPHSRRRARLQREGGAQTARGQQGQGGVQGCSSPLITFTLNLSLRRASSTLKLHFTSSYSAWSRAWFSFSTGLPGPAQRVPTPCATPTPRPQRHVLHTYHGPSHVSHTHHGPRAMCHTHTTAPKPLPPHPHHGPQV